MYEDKKSLRSEAFVVLDPKTYPPTNLLHRTSYIRSSFDLEDLEGDGMVKALTKCKCNVLLKYYVQTPTNSKKLHDIYTIFYQYNYCSEGKN